MEVQKAVWFELISKGNIEEVRKILEKHIDIINIGDWDTALHVAAIRRNKPLVELLLRHGADLTLKYTALEVAKWRGFDEIVAAIESNVKVKVFVPALEKQVIDLITSKNWQGFASFVLDNPILPVHEIIKARFPLSIRTSALQIVISSLRQFNDGMSQEEDVLIERSALLEKTLNDLKSTKQEYLTKIQAIESEMTQVQQNIKDTQAKWSDLKIESKEVSANLLKIEEILWQQQAAARELEETLKKDYTQWNTSDVFRFLEELGLGAYIGAFESNNITGAVLPRLKSNMLIEKLGMSFKEAKKFSKAIFFLQKGVSIHSEPRGVLAWTTEDVCRWLDETKSAHLVDKFQAKEITGVELAFLENYDLSHVLQIGNLGDEIHLMEATDAIRAQLNREYIAKPGEIKATPTEHKVDEELVQKVKRLTIDTPADFLCPITHEIMLDPVIASDGHTYERRAIEEWFREHNTSPLTIQQLENRNLLPSHTLKRIIRDFIDNNQPKEYWKS